MCAVAVGASSTEERSTTLRNISLLFVDLIHGKYMVGQFDSSFSLGTLVDSTDFISVFAQARLNVEGT